jgi:hypothetical protein
VVVTLQGEELLPVSTTRVFLKWSGIGLVLAVFLIWVQALAVGGLPGLLEVGESSSLRPMIEEQLGDIPVTDYRGHDGQIYYAMALDLAGNEIPPKLDHASYRYRRILYPLVASAFGLLDGWALLYGMATLAALSMAVSTGIVAAMAAKAGRSELFALSVLVNPGVWLSLDILTADVFALALMLVGLFLFVNKPTKGHIAFALSGLARETYLATPIPLGLRLRDWRTIVLPAGALVGWMTLLNFKFGDGFAVRGNLTLPFLGLIDASHNWGLLEPRELVFLAFALLMVVGGAISAVRRSWVRWPLIAWVALALMSSSWVWNFGNNPARVFAPILVLSALAEIGPREIHRAEEARLPAGSRV